MIIVNVGGQIGETGIIAFDKTTGAVIWSATDHDSGYATPRIARIHDEEYLFVLTYNGFVSLDPDQGAVHWEIPYKSPISNG
ncbi:PQQ-binding-like beta-propeller repeat protein, partial [bacterium LRH843]|nr:PQQ-binding-like beta-propeller repeat protein [bacterium LRH843]